MNYRVVREFATTAAALYFATVRLMIRLPSVVVKRSHLLEVKFWDFYSLVNLMLEYGMASCWSTDPLSFNFVSTLRSKHS